ncbi:unnamed protein product [Calicophoron daubneyi]|uniref:Hikeshi-like domain-containing protein n=1 Tax=Calicophoron daubneyi TaxID=300641 RepID=A0AAV2T050_CALDB
MFAALVAGQLVQSDFVPVSDNKFLLKLAPLNNVNHIVVFLTGAVPFPATMGGGVYIGLQQEGSLVWYFLGILTNERPSAIYKIGNLKKGTRLQNADHPFGSYFGTQLQDGALVEAHLGISVEPLNELPQPTVDSQSDLANADYMTRFAHFAAESLFNYVASFALNDVPTSDPLVPLSAIKRWFDTIIHKLSLDPSFWRK